MCLLRIRVSLHMLIGIRRIIGLIIVRRIIVVPLVRPRRISLFFVSCLYSCYYFILRLSLLDVFLPSPGVHSAPHVFSCRWWLLVWRGGSPTSSQDIATLHCSASNSFMHIWLFLAASITSTCFSYSLALSPSFSDGPLPVPDSQGSPRCGSTCPSPHPSCFPSPSRWTCLLFLATKPAHPVCRFHTSRCLSFL